MSDYKSNIARKCINLVLKSHGASDGGMDQVETADYLAEKGARQGRKVVKVAWPPEVRKEWSKAVGAVRSILNNECSPWGGAGTYITSQVAQMNLQRKLEVAVRLADKVADGLAARFDELLASAARERGPLFNRGDYPVSAEAFRREFVIRVITLPVCPENALLDIAENEREVLIEDMRFEAQQATESLMERIAEPLRKAVATLKTSDKIFRDSLIHNIKEIAEIAPLLNITDDPIVNEIIRDAKAVGVVEPDKLREDEDVRDNVAKACEDILKKMRAR